MDSSKRSSSRLLPPSFWTVFKRLSPWVSQPEKLRNERERLTYVVHIYQGPPRKLDSSEYP
jgi:hypothetical protein